MKNLILFLASICFLNPTLLLAQRDVVKNDFLAINNNYLNIDKVSMTITFKVFSGTSNIPLETETGFYRINDGKVNLKYFGIETLVNNRIIVTLDDEGRKITIDSITNQYPLLPRSVPELYLDSMFKYYKDVSVATIDANTKKYQFLYDNGEFSKIEVFVNSDTKFIKKIVNYLTQKQEITDGVYKTIRAEVEFSNINTNPLFTDEFNVNRFVKRSQVFINLHNNILFTPS